MDNTNSLAHTKWNCKYHIVFAPKYRRNRNSWATGYYGSIVGVNTATVQKWIREQGKADQAEDRLCKREHEVPSKSSA